MRLSYICVYCLLLATSMAQTEIEQIEQACKQEFPCTPEEIKMSLKNDTDPTQISDNAKCYFTCIMQKDGTFSNGSLDVQAFTEDLKNVSILKDHLPEAFKALEICKLERGANDCETGFKITKCMTDNFFMKFIGK